MRIACAIIIFSISFSVFAGNENYSIGAGPAGVANAYVMTPGVWSSYHNQAGLSKLNNMTAGFYFENRYGISELGVQSFAFALPTNSGTFGFNITYFGYSEYNESKFGLAYGKAFGERFSAGIQFDYFYMHLPGDYGSKGTMVVEGGILVEPVDKLFIGVHVFNPTRAKIADFLDERIPTIMRVGVGYKFTSKLLVSLETEKDLDNKPRIKSGIDFQVMENFYLRTGIAINPSQNYFGLGYKIKNFTANIAFSTNPVLPMSSHISLVYSFE